MIDQSLTKDARAFSDGVVRYLRRHSKTGTAVPKVQQLLTRVTAKARKEKTATVETCVALTIAEQETLCEMLEKKLQHEVVVENTVTPDLIGGMRIYVGDWVVDTTIASQLSQLAFELTMQ